MQNSSSLFTDHVDSTVLQAPPLETEGPQSLIRYLSLQQTDTDEKFERIRLRDNERQQQPGCFVDGPVAQNRDRWPRVRQFKRNHITLPGCPCGYFNGTHIELGDRKYIATQNPVSVSAFWTVTWDQGVASIIMLMPGGGNGQDRCARYFPRDVDEVIKVGDFQITLVENTIEDDRTEVRQLRVSHGSESRIVWHFAFLAWPDHGIPVGEDKLALLNLIRLSRYGLNAEVPRLVHCSAGVGRTGTFIATDYLLEQLERGALDGELEIDPVFETVDYLREKRMMMVQTEAQYRFIYDTLRWRWNDMHGEGEELGTNRSFTFVYGGPRASDKVPKWQGIPQRMEISSESGVDT